MNFELPFFFIDRILMTLFEKAKFPKGVQLRARAFCKDSFYTVVNLVTEPRNVAVASVVWGLIQSEMRAPYEEGFDWEHCFSLFKRDRQKREAGSRSTYVQPEKPKAKPLAISAHSHGSTEVTQVQQFAASAHSVQSPNVAALTSQNTQNDLSLEDGELDKDKDAF